MTEYNQAESFKGVAYVSGSNPEAFMCFQNFKISSYYTGNPAAASSVPSADLVDVSNLFVNSCVGVKVAYFLFKRIASDPDPEAINAYHIQCCNGPYTGEYLSTDLSSGKISTSKEPKYFFRLQHNRVDIDASTSTDDGNDVNLVAWYGRVELGARANVDYTNQYTAEVNIKQSAQGIAAFKLRYTKKNTLDIN
ncbi:hypothetical protein [Pseudomonas frederiksbergensis]|uniref:Uncharacterized protein n=1 Tax=Pseudomonas frederiksbergensis TaxID=104087 RepID=A0A423JRC5_9PSED|nr:hypothetical protein [Pseudomonas frederiksbergensis]RON40268.1 hypothetical protein BK666_26655 [Pseudomonas frederiksbergensis]